MVCLEFARLGYTQNSADQTVVLSCKKLKSPVFPTTNLSSVPSKNTDPVVSEYFENILVLRSNPGFASAAVTLPLAVIMCLPDESNVASVED